MSGGEIALLVCVCVAFVVAVCIIIYNKLKAKSSCDCGGSCCGKKNKSACNGCCAHCMSATPQKQDGDKQE